MCLVSLVEVDGARKVKPELRNGFVELKWRRHRKRGGGSLFRCEALACGGDALTLTHQGR